MLFSKLPDDIFKPLASPNRHIYQNVLLALYPIFFDENEAEEFFPRRESVIDEIEETLARLERLQWFAENADDPEEMEPYPSIPRCADYVYNRLVKTKWLEEDQDGYNKMVVMPPIVSALLSALIDISRNQKKSYGGTVLGILVQIEAAINNPTDMGQLLIEAYDNTRKFNNHLTSIIYGLKDIETQIISSRAPKDILSSFFDDFVTNILIADYKTLQSENNPFRFRTKILHHLRSLQADWDTTIRIAKHYEERYGINEVAARTQLMDHNQYLLRSFEMVDRRLNRIDQFRKRLEDRVSETVRYLDKTTPGIRSKLASILEAIGEVATNAPEKLVGLPSPPGLVLNPMLSTKSIRVFYKKRQPVTAQVLRESTLSPDVLARSRALIDYIAKRQITPDKVLEYIERNLVDKEMITAEDMVIETVEDYIAFTHVKRLSKLGRRSVRSSRYVISETSGFCANRWLECRGFIIQRGRE
ncbi:MAG: Wadjet anti-phage system protein JetA family protein [Desulfuromonadales bacterium]